MLKSLADFTCTPDDDVQGFLREGAVKFQKDRITSVYLYFDEEKLRAGNPIVEGYFSLAHKSMSIANCDKKMRRFLNGTPKYDTMPFVLICQIGKRIEENYRSELNIQTILNDIFNVVGEASNRIFVNNIIVECKDIDKIKNLYLNSGFIELIETQHDELHTLYMKFNNQK